MAIHFAFGCTFRLVKCVSRPTSPGTNPATVKGAGRGHRLGGRAGIRRAHMTGRIAGWWAAALAVVGLLIGRMNVARAEDAERTIAEKIRESHPTLDYGKIVDLGGLASTRTEAELAADKFHLDNAHEIVMKKWKAIQTARDTYQKVTQSVASTTGYYTLVLLSYESERKDRLQRIAQRETDDFRKENPSLASAKDIDAAWGRWNLSPMARAYIEERYAVQKWFRQSMEEEVKRARTGQSPLMTTLDEMTVEAQDEIAYVSQALRKVQRAIEKRKAGVAPDSTPEREGEEKEADEKEKEKFREQLHIAPVRTEYEGKTGEPIETLFQVWSGRGPYAVYSRAKGSTQGMVQYQTVRTAGYFSVLFTFLKAGTYSALVEVSDQSGGEKSATVSITVNGEPVGRKKEESKEDKPPAGMDDSPSSPAGSPPVPVTGTFHALLFAGADPVPRNDALPNGMVVTPVPLEITLDATGKLRGSAVYALPASQAGKPKRDGGKNLYWKSAFRLEGQVDWTTGRTHVDLLDGVAESGVEADTPGFGLWQETFRAEYAGTLDGWSIPSPAGDRWMGAAGVPAGGNPLEYTGRPEFATKPDGKRAFQGRGFFGDNRGGGIPGVLVWAKTPKKFVHRSGYAGKQPDVEDTTTYMKLDWTLAARLGFTGWYLKLVDAPTAVETEPAKKDEPPSKAELWAFGIWPTRPVQARIGEKVTARAMGVFSDDAFEAKDLSAKATWTANRPGIAVNERGEITASAPGVYQVTATFIGPDDQPMTSTMTVAVAKE